MTGRKRMKRVVGVLALLFVALGRVHAQQDKVLMRDGKERSVKILSEDYDGLWFSLEGGSSAVPWKEVSSIQYANAAKYYEALDAFGAGDFTVALPLLEALAADTKLRPVLRHGALYHLALAYQKSRDHDRALATYEELLKSFPKTRYLLPVGTNLLSIHLARGDVAAAERALNASLSNRSAGMDRSVQAGFDLLRGRILEEQQKLPEAERLFEQVANASEADPALIASAKLGLGRCAQRKGRMPDAERRYREIVVQVAPNDVLAGAWNGLGDIAFEEGTGKRDPDRLREALFAYLRGVVLYVPGPEGQSDEHERALAGSAKAFRAIGELESNAERKRLFLERARARREELASQYPDSRHLKGL